MWDPITLDALLETPLFRDLTDGQVRALSRIGRLRTVPDGEVLFREGTPASSFAVVVKGQLAIGKARGDDLTVRIATVRSGQPIGEMAILDGGLRSATVVADGAVTLVLFPQLAIDNQLQEPPALGLKVVRKLGRVLSLRLRRITGQAVA